MGTKFSSQSNRPRGVINHGSTSSLGSATQSFHRHPHSPLCSKRFFRSSSSLPRSSKISSSSSSCSFRSDNPLCRWDIEMGGFVPDYTTNLQTVPSRTSSSSSSSVPFRDDELPKIILTFVVAVTMGLPALINSSSLPTWLVYLVVLTLSFGFAFIWNGIRLAHRFTCFSIIIQEIGIGLVLMGIYALLGSLLPWYLASVISFCCFLTILPSLLLRCCPFDDVDHDQEQEDGVF